MKNIEEGNLNLVGEGRDETQEEFWKDTVSLLYLRNKGMPAEE